EGRAVDPGRELAERALVAVVAHHHRHELRRAGIDGRIHDQEAETERRAREREHARELAAAEDADRGHGTRGSAASSPSRVWPARKAASAARTAGPSAARGEPANSAAFAAPAAPIANVATGTPAGICTIESSESSPLSARDCTGTPST